MPRSSPRPAASLCASLLASLIVACSSVEVASSNLDEMHGPGGRYRYTARLTTPFRYVMQTLLDPFVLSEDRVVFGNPVSVIEDPADVCQENLLELAEVRSDRPSVLANQVRTYAWLAVEDPFALVRERALLELGPHARRLGLESLPAPADANSLINPPAFLEAVRGLYEVVRPILDHGESASETERADFLAAVDVLGDYDYDVEGGRRLLKAIAILSERSTAGSKSLQPLYQLSDRVQRQLAALALRAGLADEDDRARAAAYEAGYRTFGRPFLREAVLSLIPKGDAAPSPLYAIERVDPRMEEVFVRVARLCREDGLPTDESLTGGDLARDRLRLARVFLTVSVNHTLFTERAQTAALLTLGELLPDGPGSLRSEEWQGWWGPWSERELARADGTGDTGSKGDSSATPEAGEPDAAVPGTESDAGPSEEDAASASRSGTRWPAESDAIGAPRRESIEWPAPSNPVGTATEPA